jgi:hypothetical protein
MLGSLVKFIIEPYRREINLVLFKERLILKKLVIVVKDQHQYVVEVDLNAILLVDGGDEGLELA